MNSDLPSILQEIDAAIGAANAKFYARLRPAATSDQMRTLAAVLGVVPEPISQWFAWHAGSGDGFLPNTSVGLVTPEEAATEIAFMRANQPDRELPEPFCPLLTDRGGGFRIWVGEPEPALWTYDRGHISKTELFADALRAIRERWVDEKSSVRVAFVRVSRSFLGWQQVELPLRSKKKVLQSMENLPTGQNLLLATHAPGVRIRCSEQPSWTESDGLLTIAVSREALTGMVADLRRENSATVPGVDAAKICFSEM